jgi:hypothetical protein
VRSPASAGIAGFALTVPSDWFELELRPALREASIKALVHERVRGQPQLREARSGIVKLLLDYAERAWAGGARYCACFVQPTAEGPITGAVTVTLTAAPTQPGTVGPLTVDGLVAALDGIAAPAARPASVVEIDEVGPAARTYGVEDVPVPGGGRVRSVVMQTLLPVPASTDVVLVTGSSPVLWLEEQLLDLFDAVTSTFRFAITG